MYISENIKILRKRLGLTQSDIAERLGKTVTAVGDYERGKSTPPLEVTLQLCEIFQVNLDDLVNKDLSKEGPGRPDEEAPRKSTIPTPSDEDQELLRRLLILKIEEIAADLKEEQPELYKRFRLAELIRKEKDWEE